MLGVFSLENIKRSLVDKRIKRKKIEAKISQWIFVPPIHEMQTEEKINQLLKYK